MRRRLTAVLGAAVLGLAAGTATPVRGADNIDDLRDLRLENAKIPVYNKPDAEGGDRLLQIMVFIDRASRRGRLLQGENVVLDVIRRGSDVDTIMDNWRKSPPYPLEAPLREVADFWSWQRNAYSDGVIFSPACEIDIERRMASGNDNVYFRSPQLDLDGVGYRVDFERRTVLVTSDVKIVLRQENCDPRRFIGGQLPIKNEYVTATGDSLLIDLERNQIMLIGSVVLLEERGRLECDRLTLFIERKSGDSNAVSSDMLPATMKAASGISRILADGNVQVSDAPAAPGGGVNRLFADHLEYEMATGLLTVTGDEIRPRLESAGGEKMTADRFRLLRPEQKMYADGGCRIEAPDAEGAVRTLSGDNGFFDLAANRGELVGKVQGDDPQMTLRCDRMEFFLSGSGAKDGPGGRRELDRVKAYDHLQIVSKKADDPERGPTTLTAGFADFNYTGNRLDFHPDVRISDARTVLTTDRLELYLADRPAQAVPARTSSDFNPLLGGSSSGGKRLDRAVAIGRVKMRDPDAELSTDRMTMYFEALPEGAAPAPGVFQSGGTRLVRALCDGNLTAVNLTAPRSGAGPDTASGRDRTASLHDLVGSSRGSRTLKADQGIVNLKSNASEFHGRVSLYDEQSRLDCRDLYLFAVPERPAAEADQDIDADPFALSSESSLPSRLVIGEGLAMDRALAEYDVLMTRREEDGEFQKAGGDRAEYRAATREVVITAIPPNRPWLSASNIRQYADRIIFNTADGVFQTEGRTDTGRE